MSTTQLSTKDCWHYQKNQVEGYIKVAAPLWRFSRDRANHQPDLNDHVQDPGSFEARNAIIFSFHPKAQKCSIHAAQILYDAALKAGAPKNIIQWIDKASLENTTALIRNPKIASILATGGPGMVHAALQSGNPSNGGRGQQRCCLYRSRSFGTGLLKTSYCPSALTIAWFAQLKIQP